MKTNLGLVLLCSVVLGFTSSLAAQPINDNFANRIVLSGTNLTVTGSNIGATTEAIEASYPVFTNSVWWEWTPPSDGTLRVTATSDTFAPAIVVYGLGGQDTNLFLVEYSGNRPAETATIVYRDVHYMIDVGGFDGGSGEFQLALEFMGAPPNGTFTNRTHLGSGACRTNGWLFLAESDAAWYSWTARADGPVTFRIPEENLVLSVFSGSTETNLQLLASSEGRTQVEGTQASIEAQAGVTYTVRVSHSYGSWMNVFTVFVNLNRPPLVALSEFPGSSHYVGETRLLEAETYDSDGRVVQVEFYLYSGSWGFPYYSPVSTDASWPFECTWTNFPYFSSSLVAVATDDQGARTMSPVLVVNAVPFNDPFTNRRVLTGSSLTATSWCSHATLEQSEPVPAGAEGGSIWFTWTAPFSGAVTMSTLNARRTPGGGDQGIRYTLGVFTGSELPSLLLVTNGASPLIFNVSAGTTYQVALYGYNNPFPVYFSIIQSAPPTVQLTSPANASSWFAGSQLPIRAEAVDDGAIDHVEFYLDSSLWNTTELLGSITNPPYTLSYTVPETDFNLEVTLRAVAFDNHGLSAMSTGANVTLLPRPPVNDLFANAIQLSGSSFTVTGSVFHATYEPNEPSADVSIWYSWTAPSSGMVTLRSWTVASMGVFTGAAVDALTRIGGAGPDYMTHETRLTFASVAGVEYRIAVCGSAYNNAPVWVEMVPSAPPEITLTSPTNSSRFFTQTPVIFSANASDPDGTIQRVEFFVDGALVGMATTAPYQCSALLTNDYGTVWGSAWAVATDNSGLTKRSLLASIALSGTPPANDAFANRIPLTGAFLTVTGATANATWEQGEPNPGGSGIVWWSWRASETGPATVVLGADYYGAHVGVYTGDSLSNLVYVTAAAGNANPGVTTFDAVTGQEYVLALNALQSYGGQFWMIISQSAPPSVTITSPANSASFLYGDPILLSAEPIAPSAQVREVAFIRENGTLLALRTNAPWSTTLFLTNTSSLEETSYGFLARVTDSNGLIGYSEQRNFSVTVRRPANDLFANRLIVDGCSLVVTGSTQNATYDGYPTGYDASIWWSWTAPQDGWVTIDVSIAFWSGNFGVFSGTALNNLTRIASLDLAYNGGRMAFPVTAGTAYAMEASTPIYQDGGDVFWELHCGAPATVTITSPEAGAQFRSGSSILVTARVETPDNSRPNLEFYIDSLLFQALTNPPNPVTLTLPPLAVGYHTVAVRALGNNGVESWSSDVSFMVIPLPPANDLFTNRQPLKGFLASAPALTQYATREPAEPDPFAQPDFGTLWYSWTAPASGTLRIQADSGLAFLSLWTGDSLADLRLVTTNAGWAQLETPVSRGVTYQIACAQNWNAISLFLQADDYALITGGGVDAEGRFRFSFESLNQQSWVIEGSTDLQQWIPLGTNSTLQNFFEFVDEQSELYTRRFYRVMPAH